MDPDSAPGLDGLTAKFFQTCWGMVAPGVTNVFHSIFCGSNLPKCGDKRSLTLMMDTLSTYERVCGQQINKLKSSVSLSGNEHIQAITKIEEITRMEYKKLPIKYLGCPLYEGRKNTVLFSEMMGKILNRTGGCHTKMLSVGGRAVLIKHVLLSLPVHMLAAIHPLIGVLNQIEKMLNKFFLRGTNEIKKMHWASWKIYASPMRKVEQVLEDYKTYAKLLQ
ncbi:uncharacterized protein LOC125864161 [Solanum stenotomum]|uniref:uncharacterized protein LOC125864161 n=1 Tax=Solanum stenotomum TaxID=172797 RepID=UPI0020D057F6|nr:uncharacterized protein LOC125864161 [Solanum stenotomum]